MGGAPKPTIPELQSVFDKIAELRVKEEKEKLKASSSRSSTRRGRGRGRTPGRGDSRPADKGKSPA